jgi:hypothetical protein
MTEAQRNILRFLDARLRLYGVGNESAWVSPSEISSKDRRTTAGGCARVLRQLVAMGLAESREYDRYNSRFHCFEYRRTLQSANEQLPVESDEKSAKNIEKQP